MKDDNGYILMPAGWYPHDDDPFNGDFVQRHAMSIAGYRKVIVVFAVKSASVKKTTITVNERCNGNLVEYICYYPSRKLFDRFFSLITYRAVLRRAFAEIKKQYGMPQLVHVNIAWKAGLFALHLKKRYGCRYVVTENWTGYYDTDPGNIHTKSPIVRYLIKQVFEKADLFLPVTQDLGERCNTLFGKINYRVVENAVDTRLFYYSPEKQSKKQLLHVSSMAYQKHTDGIIEAVNRLAAFRNDFEFVLVGPLNDDVKKCLAAHTAAAAITKTTGNIPYTEVAHYMRQADLFVLFSRYENLPCVVLESLCCGVPVVATDVGGVGEVINQSNGKLVMPGDVTALVSALDEWMDKKLPIPNELVADRAKNAYSYEAIGKKYIAVYDALPDIVEGK
jgi:glycosyltransferase involved in cell wall biosynthesis